MVLHSVEDVPSYLAVNPYIRTGYRRLNSHMSAIRSLWYYHNSFIDTWTSIFTFVHAFFLYFFMSPRTLVFFLHFLNGVLHAPPSVAYHLVGCAGIGEFWFYFYQSVDYFFIFVSSMPLLLALGFATPGLSLVPLLILFAYVFYNVCRRLLSHHKYVVRDRLKDMLMLVFINTAPVAYSGSLWTLPILASYTVAGVMYGLRLPERYIHNTWFSSHSYMHVLINVAYHAQFFYLREAEKHFAAL